MTLSGTINKSLILFLLLLCNGGWLTFNGMNPLVPQLEAQLLD
jgi:hypothetical protein